VEWEWDNRLWAGELSLLVGCCYVLSKDGT
jgi:hypothetical protein